MMSSPIRVTARAIIVQHDSILLVEFNDPASGLHYNLPGGGVEPGESLHQAVRREVHEETGAKVIVGQLVIIDEYVPAQHNYKYGAQPTLALCFACELDTQSTPHQPKRPDPYQTDVKWIALDALKQTPLIPEIAEQIIEALQQPIQRDVLYQVV